MIGALELKYLSEMAALHAAHICGEVITSDMIRTVGDKVRAHSKAMEETRQIFQLLEDE